MNSVIQWGSLVLVLIGATLLISKKTARLGNMIAGMGFILLGVDGIMDDNVVIAVGGFVLAGLVAYRIAVPYETRKK